MKNKTFFISAILFLLVFVPLISFARIVPECDGPCGLCEIFLLIKNVFDFLAFKLAPPVAGFLVLVAGILFLTAAGSDKRISRAKNIFTNLIIGLIIIFASWLIVGTLIKTIGKNIPGYSPQTWSTFTCTAK